MLSERELILSRIETLQLELVKEQNDLTAIEIVLSRVAPADEGKPTTSTTPHPRKKDFADVDFEVVPQDPSRTRPR